MVPSGWPFRGFPQASPRSSSGSWLTRRSSSVSGWKPGISSSALCTRALWRARRRGTTPGGRTTRAPAKAGFVGLLAPTRASIRPLALLDALESPAVFGASEDHPRRVAGPTGHEVSPVLLDTRPVIHEHKSEVLVRPTRLRLLKGVSGRSLESSPIPPLVQSPSMLESTIGSSDVAGDLNRMRRDVPPAGDEPADKQHQDQCAEDDENDAERGHGSRVYEPPPTA